VKTSKNVNFCNLDFTLLSVNLRNNIKTFNEPLSRTKELYVDFAFDNSSIFNGLYFNLKFKNHKGEYIISTNSLEAGLVIESGKGTATMVIPAHFFNDGVYSMDLMVLNFESFSYTSIFEQEDILCFELIDDSKKLGLWSGKEKGYIRNIFEWKI
jgi:hypothetical protein